MPEDIDLKAALTFARKIAKECGKKLIDYRKQINPSEWKLATNFKTTADDWCDNYIRQAIKNKFPTHGIISEEDEPFDAENKYLWVVDPLDGTIPYTFKFSNHYGVAIALVKNNQPLLGVFYAPELDSNGQTIEYFAMKGKGAYANNKKIKCVDLDNLNHAFISCDYNKLERNKILKFTKKLLADDGVGYITTYACCTAPMAMVAEGKLHGYFSLKLEPWDMAATSIICREAGCDVKNIKGENWTLKDESIVVTPKKLTKQFFKKIL